jgi:uncharacterized iron-regulated membrane protein
MQTLSNRRPLSSVTAFFGAILRTALRLALLVLGALLMVAALAAGLLLASGAVLWALVRGRRPARDTFRARFEQARRTARPRGEVIDVEVREIPGPR